jgi:hypothetical protein
MSIAPAAPPPLPDIADRPSHSQQRHHITSPPSSFYSGNDAYHTLSYGMCISPGWDDGADILSSPIFAIILAEVLATILSAVYVILSFPLPLQI